jgi:nucleobase:cation symporter-1, NCS1 family
VSVEVETSFERGIEPVPPQRRTLGLVDTGVLWGNLGISLLLPVVGAFLVPALSFRTATLAIVVGAAIGNLMLAVAARIGAEVGAPTMVIYRAPLGIRGSFVPTVFNVLQNVGWGAFELFIIGAGAAAISDRLTGARLRPLWIVLFGGIVLAMTLGGPTAIVRKWLRRYAVWIVLGSSAYLTWYMLTKFHVGTLWSRPGKGGYPSFWQGIDLVVALPVSWIPLVADYTRFTRTGRSAFWGAGIGYFLAQVWFFLLGVLLILGRPGTDPFDPQGFVGAMLAIPAGALAMIALVVDETDEAFANIYSTAVSVQNLFPRLSHRLLLGGIGSVCVGLALVVDLVQYENFLLLLGALFVPLFGVLVADYYVLRRARYSPPELYRPGGAYWYAGGIRWSALAAWAVGFLTYNWISPGTVSWWVSAMRTLLHDWIRLPFPAGERYTWLGASLASFVVAFASTLALSLAAREVGVRRPGGQRA